VVCVCVCVFVCVCMFCVIDSLEQVWGRECAAGCFVLCVCVFAACWRIWRRFGIVSVQQVALCCVYVVCVLRVGNLE